MCINCGLICPVHDSVATLLNIPKRTYLARSCDLWRYLESKSLYADNLVSYALHNFETKHIVSTYKTKPVLLRGLEDLKLYEGRLVSYRLLPAKYEPDLYLELFEEI